jgi:hypothetical protein
MYCGPCGRAQYKEPLKVPEPEAATAGASAYVHEADAAKPVAKYPAGTLWTRANSTARLGWEFISASALM